MWVVYYWEPYEGNFGHTYFRTFEAAEEFRQQMLDTGTLSTNWETEEIHFYGEG